MLDLHKYVAHCVPDTRLAKRRVRAITVRRAAYRGLTPALGLTGASVQSIVTRRRLTAKVQPNAAALSATPG